MARLKTTVEDHGDYPHTWRHPCIPAAFTDKPAVRYAWGPNRDVASLQEDFNDEGYNLISLYDGFEHIYWEREGTEEAAYHRHGSNDDDDTDEASFEAWTCSLCSLRPDQGASLHGEVKEDWMMTKGRQGVYLYRLSLLARPVAFVELIPERPLRGSETTPCRSSNIDPLYKHSRRFFTTKVVVMEKMRTALPHVSEMRIWLKAATEEWNRDEAADGLRKWLRWII